MPSEHKPTIARRASIVRPSKLETYGSRPIPARSMSKSFGPGSPIALSPLTTIPSQERSTALVDNFIQTFKELESYRNGKPVVVDGQTLSIAAITAIARYQATSILDESPSTKTKLDRSRKVIADKVANGISIYGVSTGFGGSAHTRTDEPIILGNALMQMQHFGVLPSSTKRPDALPLQDAFSSVMPESWVRGAILVRMNSLIRGHSGVRWELIEKMNELLRENITPMVPLRGSISASGDLSPLSYIAGTLMGNPSIRVFDGPERQVLSSKKALEAHGIAPLPLASKEHLGILNGTAFSASVAALVLNDAVHLALLTQICTAMGTEALAGTRLSFNSFINRVARPHPGQIETAKNIWNLLEGSKFAVTHEDEVTIEEDEGQLRQDRYPLRTAPQFIGPQIEDLIHSIETITIEANSTTDNPLVDGETGIVHNGGNFQAMAVTNAMEKTRLSLHHFGKLLFAQSAELMDPAMNRGLPPSLAATDPSLNYHCKGIDIGTAAYVAELGYLANPVSTHIQSAEMHNQAVNSMALVSARATITSLEVLSILISSYLYSLCQALDLRAMQHEFMEGLVTTVSEQVDSFFSANLSQRDAANLKARLCKEMKAAFDTTSSMDNDDRMIKIAGTSTSILFDFLTQPAYADDAAVASSLSSIAKFRSNVASRLTSLMDQLRREYLSGARGPAPASPYLNKTRPVYEFVRQTLGIRMHGSENYHLFKNGINADEVTTGENVSLIHEAIRDGKLQSVVVSLFQ